LLEFKFPQFDLNIEMHPLDLQSAELLLDIVGCRLAVVVFGIISVGTVSASTFVFVG
jgi:hypothetical protein